MRQAARRGIGFITSSDPDPHDVEAVVHTAFLELEQQDRASVGSVAGLAWKIAYRRGQDAGRKIIREREQMRSMVTDLAVTTDAQFQADDVWVAAEQEVLVNRALGCLEVLTDEQRDIAQKTIMERESLSDWALRAGKTHQAAGRQRTRALNALRRCVDSKRSPTTEGSDDERR